MIYSQNYFLVQQWINCWQQRMQPKLRTYNHRAITQLGRCKEEIENYDKCKICIFFVGPGNGEALLAMPDIELLNILNINCNTVVTEKDKKGTNCNMRIDSILGAGSEQCCAITGPERSCAKTNSNTSCYTNSGSNLDLNNRPHDALRPTVNNNEIECSIPDPSAVTNANNHGSLDFNNRPDNTALSNNNEIKHFLPGPSKESDKKQTLE